MRSQRNIDKPLRLFSPANSFSVIHPAWRCRIISQFSHRFLAHERGGVCSRANARANHAGQRREANVSLAVVVHCTVCSDRHFCDRTMVATRSQRLFNSRNPLDALQPRYVAAAPVGYFPLGVRFRPHCSPKLARFRGLDLNAFYHTRPGAALLTVRAATALVIEPGESGQFVLKGMAAQVACGSMADQLRGGVDQTARNDVRQRRRGPARMGQAR